MDRMNERDHETDEYFWTTDIDHARSMAAWFGLGEERIVRRRGYARALGTTEWGYSIVGDDEVPLTWKQIKSFGPRFYRSGKSISFGDLDSKISLGNITNVRFEFDESSGTLGISIEQFRRDDRAHAASISVTMAEELHDWLDECLLDYYNEGGSDGDDLPSHREVELNDPQQGLDEVRTMCNPPHAVPNRERVAAIPLIRGEMHASAKEEDLRARRLKISDVSTPDEIIDAIEDYLNHLAWGVVTHDYDKRGGDKIVARRRTGGDQATQDAQDLIDLLDRIFEVRAISLEVDHGKD